VAVLVNLPGVKGHPQPDSLRCRARGIMPVQHAREAGRKPGDQPALRHSRRDKNENAIPAVLNGAVSPVDPRPDERLPERLVHRVADGQLVGISPSRIEEVLHIDDHDGTVNGRL
jgi:hypothetical protein